VTGDLDGKVAIVTGGAGGIGSATAEALAAAGARVVVADVAKSPIDAAVGRITAAGGEAAGREVDVADEPSVADLVRFTVETFGGVDIVDNNAAATHLAPVDLDVVNLSADVWDQAMAVNARGPMLLCKHAVPVMLDRGGGAVVNITSGLSLAGEMGTVAYAASKAALNALTRHVATAYGDRGVRCNAIACGLIRTPPVETQMPPPAQEVFRQSCLVPRLGTPQDVADMAVFLCSERASYVTGQVISVDGGILAHLPTYAGMRQLMAEQAGP
jgi:NAD(P)-dependent dehydrogenase (short-subunit alcohol dehydrogenase family)